MKILYVEDNDDNVYMLKNRLTRAGFTVLIGPTARRALPWRYQSSPTSS